MFVTTVQSTALHSELKFDHILPFHIHRDIFSTYKTLPSTPGRAYTSAIQTTSKINYLKFYLKKKNETKAGTILLVFEEVPFGGRKEENRNNMNGSGFPFRNVGPLTLRISDLKLTLSVSGGHKKAKKKYAAEKEHA